MKFLLRPPLPDRAVLILLFAFELACARKQVVLPVPSQPAAQSQPQTTPPPPAQPLPAPPRKSVSSVPAASQPSAPVQAPAPAPQLGDIVTPEAQRQYNAAIDQSLARAQASLAAMASRQLSKDQQGLVEQIRNLIREARSARSSDLPGAKSLSHRAEVLAKDLAESFH